MTHKQVHLTITTQTPVLLADGPAAHNLTESLDFIPGNSVRGLMANRYLFQGGKVGDGVFQRLFLTDETRFSFGFIEGAHHIPRSARSCKYYPGFQNKAGHGVLDLLLKEDSKPLTCPKCKKPIDYFTGFMDPHQLTKQTIKRRLIARTAIDPGRGAAKQGQLYSQRVIEEGQTFYASVEFPLDLETRLQRLVNKEFTAWIGTGVSRGQGWVTVCQRHHTNLIIPSWKNAVTRFQQYPAHDGKPVLAVTLLSDGLFCDDYLRDSPEVTPRHLEPLGIQPAEWNEKPVNAYVATRLVFGFDGFPVQLPRVPRLAVCAGSAFLFSAKTAEPTIPADAGIGWIGDNRREGYGQAILWHPFHLQPEGSVLHV